MTIGIKRLYLVVLGILFVIATSIRVAPLFMTGDQLNRQAVIDDGYYMLTIARNVALGRGFSISDGHIATNGTQPLGTLLYALGFVATGGDKVQGLYFALAVQLGICLAVAFLLFFGLRKYFYTQSVNPALPLAGAILWYASPTSIAHTQNGLETGLASLAILVCLLAYDALTPRLQTGVRPITCLLLGGLLGVAFLVRNDSCFLILAVLVVHTVLSYRRNTVVRGITQNLIVSAAALLAALPWLWFNVTRFGHLVPVSGRAQSLGVPIGYHFLYSLAAFIENLSLVLRVPVALENSGPFQILAGGVLLILLIVAGMHYRWLAKRFSPGVGILACFVGFLFLYYGLFFDMPSFLGRYFFPAVLLAVVVAVPAAAVVLNRLQAFQRGGRFAVVLVGLIVAVVSVALNLRTFANPANLQMQLVHWVEANVSDGAWVGAVQSGTLGYFYDRTINLDGKVDPHAFAARRAERIHEYVLARDIQYLVDWSGLAEWAQRPQFALHYELVLNDPHRNLAVLKRKDSSLAAK